MPRVQFGPPLVRLRARRAHLRRMRPRLDRPDDRPGARVAGVRRRAGREARPHRRADDVHDPRQRPLDDDRLEEQGLVRQIDPDAEPRPAVSPPEMAAADPSEQRDGTQPRVRAQRARSDGERHGPAAERPRDGRDGVPQGREQEPDPRAVDRRRRGRVAVRGVPTMQRARTLDEIANSSRVGRKEIGRTYRFMTRELKLKLMPTKPQDYVSRFCSELKLTGEVQSRAVEILKEAQDKELTSGRGPTGVAAAAIYIASILCNERRTQREVADVAGVTEVTIRNRYKELTEKLGIKVEL